jgi:ribosomal protein S18 acetylase RimI-like enzyme
MQARKGALVDVLEGDAVVAHDGRGRLVGIVSWLAEGPAAEVRAVAVSRAVRRTGTASRLLDAAHASLRAAGVTTAWLVTTNDNRAARALYERLGYRVSEVRPGAVNELRRTVKPTIPSFAADGTAITDELEYVLDLA